MGQSKLLSGLPDFDFQAKSNSVSEVSSELLASFLIRA